MNSHQLFLDVQLYKTAFLRNNELWDRGVSSSVIKKHFRELAFCIVSLLYLGLQILKPVWEWWEACELPNGILFAVWREGKRKWTHDFCFWPHWEDMSLNLSKAPRPLLDQWIVKVNFHLPVLQFQIWRWFQKNRVIQWSDLRKMYLPMFGKDSREKRRNYWQRNPKLDKTNADGNSSAKIKYPCWYP